MLYESCAVISTVCLVILVIADVVTKFAQYRLIKITVPLIAAQTQTEVPEEQEEDGFEEHEEDFFDDDDDEEVVVLADDAYARNIYNVLNEMYHPPP